MKERLSKLLNNPLRVPVSIGIISFVSGFGIGYVRGKSINRITHVIPALTPFNQEALGDFVSEKTSIVDEEIVDVGKKLVEERLNRTVKAHQGTHDTEDAVVINNIFAADTIPEDSWNYEEEISKRNPKEPHVIHKDEFYENELDYAQRTLTYYSGDDILCDEDDTPIYNFDTIIGELKFGHGSGDSTVFYVRNNQQKAEYEVICDSGMYSVQILGLEMENNDRVKDIKHSNNRRFRPEE